MPTDEKEIRRYDVANGILLHNGFRRPTPQERLGLSDDIATSLKYDLLGEWMVFCQGQVHRQLKGLINPFLSQKHWKFLPELFNQRLGICLQKRQVRLFDDILYPITEEIFHQILGLTGSNLRGIIEHCHELDRLIGGASLSESDYQNTTRALTWLYGYVDDHLGEICDARPHVLSWSKEHGISLEGQRYSLVHSNIVMLLYGFVSTSPRQIASLLTYIAAHDLFESLGTTYANSPRKYSNAISELMRVRGLTKSIPRVSQKGLTIEGVEFGQNEKINILVSEANADLRVFQDPLTYCPDRENARNHLTFGAGPHYCPGAGLFLEEVNCFLAFLFENVAGIRVQGGQVREVFANTQTLSELIVEFSKKT